jgi:hypothetical protein
MIQILALQELDAEPETRYFCASASVSWWSHATE